MNGEKRRYSIIARLEKSTAPVNASVLAEEFSVTRQIIVADVALLRASGYPIRAEHKGYVLDKPVRSGLIKRMVVKHGKDDVKEEFYAIVDNGGKVLDVIVEHPIYGKISVEMNIASRYDADTFVESISEAGVKPLSLLTEGLHVHTVAAPDEKSFERIVKRLTELDILIEST